MTMDLANRFRFRANRFRFRAIFPKSCFTMTSRITEVHSF